MTLRTGEALPDSDVALIGRIVQRDETALEALYDRYAGMLSSVLNRILHDTQSAEEILQDIFYQLWQKASQFDATRGSLPGWLMVIAYPIALLVAIWSTFKIGLHRRVGPMGLWGAVVACYDVAAFAVLFSYCLFNSQSGLEFWLLYAALYSATQVYLRSLNPIVPEGFEVAPAPWQPGVAGATPTLARQGIASEAGRSQPRHRRPLQYKPLPAVVPVFNSAERPETPS